MVVMAILTQAAFASQLGSFLNGVGPLMSKMGDVTICYDLYHCASRNKFLIQDLPNLIRVPELSSADKSYLRTIGDSYSVQADQINSQGSEGPREPANSDEFLSEPYSLYEQLMLIQDSVNQSINEVWTLYQAAGCIAYVRPVFQKRAEKFNEQALDVNENFDLAAYESLRAGVFFSAAQMYYDISDSFRKSAELFRKSHLYSSAAVLSELAALVRELRIPMIADEEDLEWATAEAKRDRSEAAENWHRSIGHFNRADGENNFVDGVKLLRGIVNGLLGETDLSDTTVDWLLGMASIWHYEEEEFLSQANDLMYLGFRKVSRDEPLPSEMWVKIAKIIERADLIWRKEGIAYHAASEVESLIASAMNFSGTR